MICAYTSIHTYYSVLKKGAPTLYFAKKKKKKDETRGRYAKEHRPDTEIKNCIILSVESLKSLLLL